LTRDAGVISSAFISIVAGPAEQSGIADTQAIAAFIFGARIVILAIKFGVAFGAFPGLGRIETLAVNTFRATPQRVRCAVIVDGAFRATSGNECKGLAVSTHAYIVLGAGVSIIASQIPLDGCYDACTLVTECLRTDISIIRTLFIQNAFTSFFAHFGVFTYSFLAL